jgi:spermidine synthase
VKAWTLLDRAQTPAGQTVTLHEHDGSYYIQLDGQLLMSTRQHASEERLAALACTHIKNTRRARVLIGGLGFGFTLRAALAALPRDATVLVAELLAPIIDWNRNPALPLAADALADRRVSLLHRDVADVIGDARGEFDAIILDVDNGPAAMSVPANRRLYDHTGLQRLRNALRPTGCVALWSAAPDPAFSAIMTRAGFAVETHHPQTRGVRHTIFLAAIAPSRILKTGSR